MGIFNINKHIHIYIHSENEHLIINKLNKIMAKLSDVQALVEAEDNVIDSAITLLEELAQAVRDLTPDQAAIDALAADIEAKTGVLANAVVANTPAAP